MLQVCESICVPYSHIPVRYPLLARSIQLPPPLQLHHRELAFLQPHVNREFTFLGLVETALGREIGAGTSVAVRAAGARISTGVGELELEWATRGRFLARMKSSRTFHNLPSTDGGAKTGPVVSRDRTRCRRHRQRTKPTTRTTCGCCTVQ